MKELLHTEYDGQGAPFDEEFFLTTRLEYEDGTVEGQVLHVGSRESCESLAGMIDAINIPGDVRKVKGSVMWRAQFPEARLKPGQKWRYAKCECEEKGTTTDGN